MKDLFISYNSADKQWAEWIAWQLEEAEYTTVLQAWDFRPGSNFALEMDRAAKEAERTIPVLSPDYLSARFTQPEWAVAFAEDPTGEKGTVLPVRVRECDVKGLLGQIIYIDLVGLDQEVAKNALLEGVKQGRAKPAKAPGFPGAVERSVAERPRYPGALPPIWNVPHPRNRNFTGREELLASLHKALTAGEAAALTQTQAISGLGGVGKTQLAVEYAYRYAAEYDVVWWIRSEEPATLASDFAALAQPLDLPQKDAADQPLIVEAVKGWLGREVEWLLIFDNAPGPDEVRAYLPQAATGHVIITSRNPNWRGVAMPLSVEVWARAESVEFLLKRTGQEDEAGANELAEELGDLPLALEQAGAYVEETGATISGYLDLFRSRRRELWEAEHAPSDYPETVGTTWSLAMDKVREESPVGADLLNLCAYLGPEEIPRTLLLEGKEHLPKRLAKAVSQPMAMDRAIGALRRYSLVQAEKDSLTVHRLLQAVVRDRLPGNAKRNWAGAAVRVVNGAFPFESDDVRTWPECARLLSHGLASASHAERLDAASDEAGRLLNQTGVYLKGRAEFAEARGLYERALKIGEAAHGPNHPKVAIRVNNLGSVLQDMGDLEGAKKHYERALRIDEAAFGLDHPGVATDVNNLGSVLQDMGDLEGARRHYERALKIDEAAYGPDHPKVAIRLNNLGGVLKSQGDLEGAKANFERALRIDEAAFGRDHPKVAIRVNNLGSVLKAMGELQEAKKHFERALRIDEAVFGPNHPAVARDVNNLGSALKAQGDLAGAKADYERALKICREFLGEDHPNTVTVRKNLESLGK